MDRRVWSLRSRRCRRVIEHALRQGKDRFHTHVVQIAVMGDHIHLLVEASDHISLARAMKGLSVRLGIHLNRLMATHGRVMGDRYHVRLLDTPTEVKNVIHYIRNNFRKHEAQRGNALPASFIDPYSSDGDLAPYVMPAEHFLIRKVSPS